MCIGLLVSGGCVSVRDCMDMAVGQYDNAGDVGVGKLVQGPGIRSLMNEWQIRIRTHEGKYALVDSTGSRVKVLHPFDKSLHVFYSYSDNYYPSELRQSADRRFLYLEIQGVKQDGSAKGCFVLIYDLERREVIGRAEVGFLRP